MPDLGVRTVGFQVCLVLSREWGNGLWRQLFGDYMGTFPHSLPSTREFQVAGGRGPFVLAFSGSGFSVQSLGPKPKS